MPRTTIGRVGLAAVFVLGLLAAACNKGNANASSGGGGPTLKIATPANGASVSEPFTLKFDASVPLGQPSTGDDHVHVCYDGASCDSGNYKIAYGDTFQVTGLSAGKHTIEASLRHADHSPAGATSTITVTIKGTGGGGQTGGGGGGGGGYGY